MRIYRSPSSEQEQDRALINLIDTACRENQTPIIIGDFNLPGIDWHLEDEGDSQVEYEFMHCFQQASLYQHVRHPTRSRFSQRPAILDLVLTRLESEISDLKQEVPLGKSDHNVLLFQTCIVLEKPPRKYFRNYGKMQIEALVKEAETIDWLPPKSVSSVDERCNVLRDHLLDLMDKYAPLQPKGNAQNPPWWRACIKRAITIRASKWRSLNLTGGHEKWLAYKRARNQASKLVKKAKMEY